MTRAAARFIFVLRATAVAIGLGGAWKTSLAQDTPAPSAPQPSAATQPSSALPEPNPYYLGVRQAFTHDSNVFRIANGPSDTYSTTSLFGGFDQRLGRQRVFGTANVGTNRYLNESTLDNVSYGVVGGLAWETIESLSGNVNVNFNRSLAAPVTTSAAAVPTRNIAQSEGIDGSIRWGGTSLLSLEASLGYSRINYSAPESVTSNSNQEWGGLRLSYHPGGPLRLGVGGHVTRTKTPQGLFDPATGNYLPTTIESRNFDLFADYEVSGLMNFNGRLSYTTQSNSGLSNGDLSGFTGSVGLVYRATGKTSFELHAARDAGYDSSFVTTYAPITGPNPPVLTPVSILYQNNRVTDSFGFGATYAATAKISTQAGVHYSRARLASTTVATGSPAEVGSTDKSEIAYLGANWSITRNWSAACNLSHEYRKVSGEFTFSYEATVVGCSTQFQWP